MSFTVQCPHCGTEFPVDPAKVPAGGVRARCTSCEGIFLVEVPIDDIPAVESSVAESEMVTTDVAPEFDTPQPMAPEPAVETPALEEPIEAEVPTEIEAEPDPIAPVADSALVDPVVEEPEVAESSVDTGDTGFDDVVDGRTIEAEEQSFQAPPAGAAILDDSGFGGGFDDEAASGEAVAESFESADDWVLEQEEAVLPTDVEVDRLDTVEEQVRGFQDESYEPAPSEGIGRVVPGEEEAAFSGYSAPDSGPATVDPLADVAPVPPSEADVPPAAEEPAIVEEISLVDGTSADATGEATPPAPPASADDEETPTKPAAFTFGKRDPHEKAKRLARVLVSDMITYNPDRHTRAVEQGAIREDFEDEIAKSWQEYVDQVGGEIAESTDYWTQALNDVLAKGEQLF